MLTTLDKAKVINDDDGMYGTFAEIGAGQEVARFFFRAGSASNTIAKTMSAYDMKFSDAIYGAEESYVCQPRVDKMLEREFELLEERLAERRCQRDSLSLQTRLRQVLSEEKQKATDG